MNGIKKEGGNAIMSTTFSGTWWREERKKGGMDGWKRDGKGREEVGCVFGNKTIKFRIDKDIARLKEHPNDCTRRDAE